ncbi:amidohydrolase [hydrocarbon metagenome]|uniref:Amidohydrolase n=1 Tax=hydrocarbon metagenome TaxID=938273 RepID=A0A0W8G8R5_9ZZZZ
MAQADALGLLDARTLAVHAVHVDDADIRILVERGCGVCLCPRSNAFIGVGRAPWEKLAAAGARLCLGTDSLASNTDLDLWNEVRYLLKHGKRFSLTAALAALTTTPARVLGREKTMGMLAPGMRSGVTLLPGDLVGA